MTQVLPRIAGILFALLPRPVVENDGHIVLSVPVSSGRAGPPSKFGQRPYFTIAQVILSGADLCSSFNHDIKPQEDGGRLRPVARAP